MLMQFFFQQVFTGGSLAPEGWNYVLQPSTPCSCSNFGPSQQWTCSRDQKMPYRSLLSNFFGLVWFASLRKRERDSFGFNTNHLKFSCAFRLQIVFVSPSSDDCSSKSLRRPLVVFLSAIKCNYFLYKLTASHSPIQVHVLFLHQSSLTQIQRIHVQSSFRSQSTDSIRDFLSSG